MIKQYWKYIAGLGLFLAAIIWCLVAVYSSQVAANIATIVGAIAAALGLAGIYWQLSNNAKQARRLKTYEISGKIQDSEFLLHLSKARGFFVEDKSWTNDEKWNNYNDGKLPDIAIHVFISLAYFEDMALLYNRHYIDRDLIKSLLRAAIIGFYNESKWFRDKAKRKDKESYIEFDKMCKDLNS